MKFERVSYIFNYILEGTRVVLLKIFKRRKNLEVFGKSKNLTIDYGSKRIEELILHRSNFSIVRMGSSECSCVNNYLKIKLGFKKKYKKSVVYVMKNNAGFYPTETTFLNLYSEKTIEALEDADMICRLGSFMEDYIIKKSSSNPIIGQNQCLDPLKGKWTKCLAGKKVLVVSPFSEDVLKQYKNRENIFPNDNILPAFDLKTYTSPYTLGNIVPNDDFFSILENMISEISKIDFDIALVGCGAYSTLLCYEIKKMGKSAIQTSGATQLLFGITGKRWENSPTVKKYLNNYWIKPTSKPSGFENVENGCYW